MFCLNLTLSQALISPPPLPPPQTDCEGNLYLEVIGVHSLSHLVAMRRGLGGGGVNSRTWGKMQVNPWSIWFLLLLEAWGIIVVIIINNKHNKNSLLLLISPAIILMSLIIILMLDTNESLQEAEHNLNSCTFSLACFQILLSGRLG